MERVNQKRQTKQFRERGWVFIPPNIFPELRELGVVQRFASQSGDYVHEVRNGEDGVTCSCPGWRKHWKCWHIRWVLKHNIGDLHVVGVFLERMPTAREQAENEANHAWLGWFDEHIAVVPVEEKESVTGAGRGSTMT